MSPGRIVLSGVSPKLRGLQWSSDSLLRIGRQESYEVVFSDRSVGKRHAEVAATSRGWAGPSSRIRSCPGMRCSRRRERRSSME